MVNISNLADDELQYIFTYCTTQSLLKCLRVCKLWNEFCKTIPLTLHFNNSQFNNVKKNLQKSLQLHSANKEEKFPNFNLTELNLDGFTGTELIMNSLYNFCKEHPTTTNSSPSILTTLKSLQLGMYRKHSTHTYSDKECDSSPLLPHQGGKFINPIIMDEIIEFCCCGKLQNLQSLNLAHRNLNTKQVEKLISSPSLNESLTSLDLSGNSNSSAIIFSNTTNTTTSTNILKNLTKLSMNDCYVEQIDETNSLLFFPNNNLKELHLGGNFIHSFRVGSNFQNLTLLNFHGGPISDTLILSLCHESTILHNLIDLDLSKGYFSDGLLDLVIQKFRLQRLVLFDSSVSDSACHFISQCESMSNLTSLNLGRAKFCTEQALINLSTSPHFRLKRLILDFIQLNETAVQSLSSSTVFSQLTDLSLSYCGISTNSMKLLANSKNFENLLELQLKSNTQIGCCEGLSLIGNSPYIKNLTYLNLCNTQQHPQQQQQVEELLMGCSSNNSSDNFHKIIEIDLSANNLVMESGGDSSVERLIEKNQLLNFPRLKQLLVDNGPCTNDLSYSRPHQVNFK